MAKETEYYIVLDASPSASEDEKYKALVRKVDQFVNLKIPNDQRAQRAKDALSMRPDHVSSDQPRADDQNGKFDPEALRRMLLIVALMVTPIKIDSKSNINQQKLKAPKALQKQKENLAKSLKNFLRQYGGDTQGFKERATFEAKLLSAAFGDKPLRAIGKIYKSAAQDSGKKTAAQDLRKKTAAQDPEKKTTAQDPGKKAAAQDPGKKRAAQDPGKKTAAQKTLSEFQWKLNADDIEKTFSDVCRMVFEKKEDLKCSQGLELLGEVFQGKKQYAFLDALKKFGQAVKEFLIKEAKKGFDINQE